MLQFVLLVSIASALGAQQTGGAAFYESTIRPILRPFFEAMSSLHSVRIRTQ